MIIRPDRVPATVAWEPGPDGWRGWWSIGNGRASPGSPVAAVSRSPDLLDIFMVGSDGRVWTAAWEPGQQCWKGWRSICDLKTLPTSVVGAVSRSTNKLDIFVTNAGGFVYTAVWEPG